MLSNYDKATQAMAHRFIYYVLGYSVIPDYLYDELENEALKEVTPNHPLNTCGSSDRGSYSQHIQWLGYKEAWEHKENL